MRFPAPFRRSAFDLAIQQLRDGRPGESGYGRRIALLLTIPTFDDPIARDIRRAATGELYVVRTVWNRALDLATWRIGREIPPGLGRVPLAGIVGTARLPQVGHHSGSSHRVSFVSWINPPTSGPDDRDWRRAQRH